MLPAAPPVVSESSTFRSALRFQATPAGMVRPPVPVLDSLKVPAPPTLTVEAVPNVLDPWTPIVPALRFQLPVKVLPDDPMLRAPVPFFTNVPLPLMTEVKLSPLGSAIVRVPAPTATIPAVPEM